MYPMETSKVRKIYRAIEDWTSGTLLIGGLCIMLYQVLLRYVFHLPTTWQDEVSRYFIVWGALIGSVVAIRDNQHITVDIVYQIFPKIKKKYLEAFAHISMLIFFGFLIYFGSILVQEKLISGQTSYSGFKLWLIFFILPLSGLLMFIRTFIKLIDILKGKEVITEDQTFQA